MGSRIAAHIANAGVPVVLLDIVSPETPTDAPPAARNKLARAALDSLKKSKPPAFYTPDAARYITPGNFDDDLALITDCDWIIEAIAEILEIKRLCSPRSPGTASPARSSSPTPPACLSPASPNLCPPTCASTSSAPTSSIRHATCGCWRSSQPPTPTLRTSPRSRASATGAWAKPSSAPTTRQLHRQHHRTPDARAIRLMGAGPTIAESHAHPPRRPPKTGTFRLVDLVGVDVIAHVAGNFTAQAERIADERTDPRCPPSSAKCLPANGSATRPSKVFTRRSGKDEQGRDLRLALDWKALEYHPSQRPKFPRSIWPRVSSRPPRASRNCC